MSNRTIIVNAAFKDASNLWHIVPVKLPIDVNNNCRPIWPVTISWNDEMYKFKNETSKGRVFYVVVDTNVEPDKNDFEHYADFLEEKLAQSQHIAYTQHKEIVKLNKKLKEMEREKMENETFNLNEVLPEKKKIDKRPDNTEDEITLSPDKDSSSDGDNTNV